MKKNKWLFSISLEDRLTPKVMELIKMNPELAKPAVRKLAFEGLRRIILKSPKRTGRFIAGWWNGIEQLNEWTGNHFEIDFSGPMIDAEAIEEGKKQGKIKENLNAKGYSIEITNSVRYGIFLEHGFSPKSPFGMVRVSISELKGIARDAFRKDFIRELQMFWKHPGYKARALSIATEAFLGEAL